MPRKNKVGYVGVQYDKMVRQFCATITHNGVKHTCGYDPDEREAAKLRDLRIIKLGLPLSKLQVLKPNIKINEK